MTAVVDLHAPAAPVPAYIESPADAVADAIYNTVQTRFSAVVGETTFGALDWQGFLAMLSSLLLNCPTPTAASVRAQFKRLIPQVRMRNALIDKYGFTNAHARQSISAVGVLLGGGNDATGRVIPAATDTEVTAFIGAAIG